MDSRSENDRQWISWWIRLPYLILVACGLAFGFWFLGRAGLARFSEQPASPMTSVDFYSQGGHIALATFVALQSAAFLRWLNACLGQPRKTTFSSNTPANACQSPARDRVSRLSRWRRWTARHVDYFLWAVVLYATLSLIAPDTATWLFEGDSTLSDWIAPVLVAIAGIVPEAMFLSTLGGTPGKWLLGIEVENADGGRLSFRDALWRSLRVWGSGVGCNLPLVNLVAMSRAWRELDSSSVNARPAPSG